MKGWARVWRWVCALVLGLCHAPLHARGFSASGQWLLWMDKQGRFQGRGLSVMQYDKLQRSEAVLLEQLDGVPLFRDFALRGDSLLALRPDGSVYGFGDNGIGTLGQGVAEFRIRPMPPDVRVYDRWINGLRLIHGIVGANQLALGGAHSLAVLEDGALCAWGFNDVGQLGAPSLSSSRMRLTPPRVGGLPSMRLAAAGDGHSMALDTQGRLWTWGLNNMGQLGDGTRRNRFQPRMVAQAGPYVALAAGAGHSLALDDQGRVWSWGDNSRGQLGRFTGNNAFARKPALVQGLAPAIQIGAAGDVSAALGRDGSVWWWGGRLGRNVAARQAPWQLHRLEGLGPMQGMAVFAQGLAVTDTQQRLWLFTEPYDQPPRLVQDTKLGLQ
jgi:hypothetical protein